MAAPRPPRPPPPRRRRRHRRPGGLRRRTPLHRTPPARPHLAPELRRYVAWRGQLFEHRPDLCAFTRYEPGSSQFNIFPVLRKDGTIGVDWTFYLNMTAACFRYLIGYDPTHRTYVLPHQIGWSARTVVLSEAERLLPPSAVAMISATREWHAAPVLDIDPPQRMVHPVGQAAAVLLGDALAPVRPYRRCAWRARYCLIAGCSAWMSGWSTRPPGRTSCPR
ncbi:hypothetical protein GCM10009850_079740 [Nonomuraea monospora]|uniref:Uncharacterized protein n=1 Tax=Nonomuraea monospora TaxID=568818 RepID=A0ABN3CST1_9ACTN